MDDLDFGDLAAQETDILHHALISGSQAGLYYNGRPAVGIEVEDIVAKKTYCLNEDCKTPDKLIDPDRVSLFVTLFNKVPDFCKACQNDFDKATKPVRFSSLKDEEEPVEAEEE